MFEDATPDALIGEIEASQQQESALMAHRCAAIAALLWCRIGERNHMWRVLILFKGREPSTSPWCTWVTDPFEPEGLPPDWKPPPPPPQQLDDEPPF